MIFSVSEREAAARAIRDEFNRRSMNKSKGLARSVSVGAGQMAEAGGCRSGRCCEQAPRCLGTFIVMFYWWLMPLIPTFPYYQRPPSRLETLIMAVSAQVQALLSQVALNTSLEQSADLALKALSAQITSLSNQVAALQAQIAAGTSLSADDIAALATSVTELQTSATTLQADVPANTTPAPAPAAKP